MAEFPSYDEFTKLLNLFDRIKKKDFEVNSLLEKYYFFASSGFSDLSLLTTEIEWLWYCHKIHPIKYSSDFSNKTCSLSHEELIESSEKQKKIAIHFANEKIQSSEIESLYNDGYAKYIRFFVNLNPRSYNTPKDLITDLLWHLHMNNPSKYHAACMIIHKNLINHRYLSKDMPSKSNNDKQSRIEFSACFECG